MPGWAIGATAGIAVLALLVVAWVLFRWSKGPSDAGLFSFLALGAGFVVWALCVMLPLTLQQDHQWADGCRAQGGRVDHSVCLTPDGRVISAH